MQKKWPDNHISNFNCVNYCIAVIADYLSRDYIMSLLELWKFGYSLESKDSIGKRLEKGFGEDFDRLNYLVSKYHGIKMESLQIEGRTVIKQIDECLLTLPVMAFIDSYNCDWLPYYKKIHCNHAIIIFSHYNHMYCFKDVYLKDSYGKKVLTESFIKDNIMRLVTISYSEIQPVYKSEELIYEIRNCCNIYKSKGFYLQFESFLWSLNNQLDLRIEIPNGDPTMSILLKNLKYLSEDRENLIIAIEFVERKTGYNYAIYKNALWKLAKNYDKLRFYLIKSLFSAESKNNDKIKRTIEVLYTFERIMQTEI